MEKGNIEKLCDRCVNSSTCGSNKPLQLESCAGFRQAQVEISPEKEWKMVRDRKAMGNCLHEADKIINGERQDEYGCPEDSFEIIAGYWNVFLRKKINDACHGQGVKLDIPDLLTPLDTTNMMILFKQARKLGQKPKRDNYVDSAGYEAIGADRLMVAEAMDEEWVEPEGYVYPGR